jgi:hypothetical protein
MRKTLVVLAAMAATFLLATPAAQAQVRPSDTTWYCPTC